MLLNEYLEGVSIFALIKSEGDFDFIPTDSVSLMDAALTLQYGEREVFKPINDMLHNTLAGLIALKYTDKWNGYVQAQDLLVNPNERREISETINTTEERENTKDDVNKISAYNSDVLLDDTGANSTGSDSLEGERVRVTTDENITPEKTFNMLAKNTQDGIINNVIKDVAVFITLSIY